MADPTSRTLQSAREEIRALGEFDDGERPVTEAEYRYKFRHATEGLKDEDRAHLWVSNLKFRGEAYHWFKRLTKTREGEEAANKWSTLEPLIEECWGTPDDDEDQIGRYLRRQWRKHVLDMSTIAPKLRTPSLSIQPHVEWAIRHKSIAAQLNHSPADLVAETIDKLPPCIIALLPKRRRYRSDFKLLMQHIMEVDALDLADAYENEEAAESLTCPELTLSPPQPLQLCEPTPCHIPSVRPTVQRPILQYKHPTPNELDKSILTTYSAESVPLGALVADEPEAGEDYTPEVEVIDLSGVDVDEKDRQWPMKFRTTLTNNEQSGEIELWGTTDGGAMLCVLDSTVWAQIEHSFGSLAKSQVVCRMANGTRVPSWGTASGHIRVKAERRPITFEVLDSGGAFDLLIGKDWLAANGAEQIFSADILSLRSITGTIYINNENPDRPLQRATTEPREPEPEPQTAEPEQLEPRDNTPSNAATDGSARTEPGGRDRARQDTRSEQLRRSERIRERQERSLFWLGEDQLGALAEATGMLVEEDDKGVEGTLEESLAAVRLEAEEHRQREIMAVETEEPQRQSNPLQDAVKRAKRTMKRRQATEDLHFIDATRVEPIPQPEPRESERTKDPFNPGRVAEIVSKVKIGEDLSEEQKTRVKGLVGEFADIFTSKLSEVLPVSITEMKLDIPEGATFPKRAGQRKMSKPEQQALYGMLDEMEDAQVIKRVTQDQVAAVSPINLVPKPSSGSAPTMRTIHQMVNSECRRIGIPIKHPEVGFYEVEQNPVMLPAKWRLVQNFAAVNKVTQVRPFPMGDLVAKQRAVAGHRYISVMDFHAGFHAIPRAPESVPYTGFHVEGRGYYVYLRMPFGLTGAPTTFCEMVAAALSDLIGRLLEIWMDDMATAAEDFETGLSNLRIIFERCRTHKISLSAAKTVLFMSEAIFAGARISKEGIRPDLAKVKAILEWPEPKTVLEVMSFLGLVNAYRSKIKNFARIAQPLSDLTRDVRPDKEASRSSYKKALQDTRVTLNDQARQAFVKLKLALTTDPVLKPPAYDGRSFIIATDGSKAGFGAVLSQKWEETDSKGNTRKVTYPIAFASKRTSRSEEKYPPFLLEFAALKFACDEFDSLIFGQPVEIETDCKALADLLGNNKLNSTHERWRESIIARNIVAVRHKPGIENGAPDALSRTYERRMDTNEGQGQDWDVDPGWEARANLVNDLYHLTTDDTAKPLLDRFAKDPEFSDIILYLLYDVGTEPKNDEDARNRKRMAHKAEGYMINGGKLWLTGGKHSRGSNRVECIPQNEGLELAHAVHSAGGHFGRDLTVLALQQEYHWPKLRRDAEEAVVTCPKCRNFGPRLMSALLKPITRARPFDLLVADYVAFSEGHGGLKNVLIFVDVYSRFMFAFPTSKPGTGKFTVKCLSIITEHLMTPSSFMADGGSHFDCEEVKRWAADHEVQVIKTPPYAPWTNGLAEGGVKLLAGRLKRLCAPNLGISTDEEADPLATPRSWPLHLSTAVNQLNDRRIPSLTYSPRELLTGVLSSERKAEIGQDILARTSSRDIDVNLALTYALRNDAHAKALEHANRRKRTFDKKVKPIEYKPGSVVQRYDGRLDETHNAVRKLAGRWSGAVCISRKLGNSYDLVDLDGNPFAYAVHARLLRPFHPRAGTPLAAYTARIRQAQAGQPEENSPAAQPTPLPIPVRPEEKLPLPREDATQPNNYQDNNDDDDNESTSS